MADMLSRCGCYQSRVLLMSFPQIRANNGRCSKCMCWSSRLTTSGPACTVEPCEPNSGKANLPPHLVPKVAALDLEPLRLVLQVFCLVDKHLNALTPFQHLHVRIAMSVDAFHPAASCTYAMDRTCCDASRNLCAAWTNPTGTATHEGPNLLVHP